MGFFTVGYAVGAVVNGLSTLNQCRKLRPRIEQAMAKVLDETVPDLTEKERNVVLRVATNAVITTSIGICAATWPALLAWGYVEHKLEKAQILYA